MIGMLITERPMPMGIAITAEIRIESSDIFAALLASPRAKAPEIAGTMEIVSGVMKAAGRLKKVCALPYTP